MRIVHLKDSSGAEAEFAVQNSFMPESSSGVEKSVTEILADVRARGDAAVFDYSKRFDGCDLTTTSMRVPAEEIRSYAQSADPHLVDVLRQAISNVRDFHQAQIEKSWEYYAGDGVRLGLRITPIERVGLYIPGGKAAYPSSVMMNAVPAQVAGVPRLVVVTPPKSLEENPLVAAALDLLNIDEVYRIGGAHSVAALAYGTPTVPRVDKIVGPGNVYVQTAKRLVYGTVDIDMTAGPSEVAIIADDTCNPAWAAADLLAQAEHDELAGAWLVCWSDRFAAAVRDQVQIQLEALERRSIARTSIEHRGVIFVARDEDDAIALVNRLAPEHVEILMAEPDHAADNIRNAGALFIGRYAPTVVGDYFAGPSHVLPTGRSARFFSPLGVHSFMKRTSVIRYSGRAIERFGTMIEDFATAEGLTGHANSITVRRHQA